MMRIHDALCPGNIFFKNRTFTPSEIIAGVNQFARRLDDELVSKSPFVYLFASNNIKTILALYGIVKAGRICVVVDPRIGRLELAEMRADTPPAACVRMDDAIVCWDFDRELEILPDDGRTPLPEDLDDVCMMMYTAADDGFAKAAMLTHENVLADAFAIAAGNGVTPGTVSLAALPMSHGFGLQTGLFTPTVTGADAVIAQTGDTVNARNLYRLLQERRVTHFYSIPAVYYLLCKAMRHEPRSTGLKSLISGGYALKKKQHDAMMTVCGLPIRQGYGLTEAAPVCSWVFNGNDADSESIGRPIACCDMKIARDPADNPGAALPGEILVKGTNVMKGYYRHQAVNSRVLRDGWLHTGDIGYEDGNGYFFLQKTKKRMINHAGMKVYPAEVERHLKTNDNIAATVLYGIDDPIAGEKVGCTMQLKTDTPALRESIRRWMSDGLSDFKLPGTIRFVNEHEMGEAIGGRE
jgi:long-chain acyl-CoA synthetase